MARLSKELLEKLALEKSTFQNIQDHIDRELRLLVEEVAKRYTK